MKSNGTARHLRDIMGQMARHGRNVNTIKVLPILLYGPWSILVQLYHKLSTQEPPNTPLRTAVMSAPPVLNKDCTREEFLKASDNYRRPVIVKGLFEESACVRLWDLDYLARFAAPRPIPVINDAEKNTYDLSRKSSMTQVTASEFFEELKIDRQLTSYMNNISSLVGDHPRLKADLELHRIQHLIPVHNEVALTHGLFIGSRAVRSSWHCADETNFFIMVKGRKRWRWLDPKYSMLFVKQNTTFGGLLEGDPANRRLPVMEYEVQPGDLVYNAPYFWHDVINLDDISIACANRFYARYWTAARNNSVLLAINTARRMGHIWRHGIELNDDNTVRTESHLAQEDRELTQ